MPIMALKLGMAAATTIFNVLGHCELLLTGPATESSISPSPALTLADPDLT